MRKTLVLFFSLFFLIILINLVSAQVTHKDAYTDCEDNMCVKTIGGYPKNINYNNQWIPFNSYCSVEKHGYYINFSALNYDFVLKPYVIYNSIQKTAEQIHQAYPNIDFNPILFNYNNYYKFGINFTGINESLIANVDYLVLKLEDSNGIGWDDVSKDNSNIYLPNNIKINFRDLIEHHFTLNLVSKTEVWVGNLTDKFVCNNSICHLWVDPTIQYNFSNQTNIWAEERDNAVANDPSPPNNGPRYNISSYTASDVTGVSTLDLIDSNPLDSVCSSNEVCWQTFYANLSNINESSILKINWTIIVSCSGTSCNGETIYVYHWNDSSDNWIQCGSISTIGYKQIQCVESGNPSDFINGSGYVHAIVHLDTGNVESIYTDFVKLEVLYNEVPPTYSNIITTGSNKTNTIITFNTTWGDENLYGWYFRHNQTGTMTNQTFNTTWSGAGNNISTYNLNLTLTRGQQLAWGFCANDSFNNWNCTDDQVLTVANTVPLTPTLYKPDDTQAFEVNWVLFNYSSTDADNDTITYFLYSDNTANPTTLIYNGTSQTFNYTSIADNTYYWKVQAGDSYDNSSNSTIRSYTISTTAPAITLNYLSDDDYLTTSNVWFNFTASDVGGVDVCKLYSNFSGVWGENETLTSITSGVMTNFSLKTLSEGTYKWNVWCNDTSNNGGYSAFNRTINIDLHYPSLSVSSPTQSATYYSQTISLIISASDYYLDSCYYKLYLKATGTLLLQNDSITCVGTTSIDTSAWSDFTLNVYANDSATQVNSTQINFTTQVPPVVVPTPSGGGGEVKEPPKKNCSILVTPDKLTFYSDITVLPFKIINNENSSISPTYTLTSTNFEIRGAESIIQSNKTDEITILRNYAGNNTLNETLTVSFATCYDKTLLIEYLGEKSKFDFIDFLKDLEFKIRSIMSSKVNLFGLDIRFFMLTILSVIIVASILTLAEVKFSTKMVSGIAMILIINLLLGFTLKPVEASNINIDDSIVDSVIDNSVEVKSMLNENIVKINNNNFNVKLYYIGFIIFVLLLGISLLIPKYNWYIKGLFIIMLTVVLTTVIYFLLKYLK